MRLEQMACPECGSDDVKEVDNLTCLWCCEACGHQEGGELFDISFQNMFAELDRTIDEAIEKAIRDTEWLYISDLSADELPYDTLIRILQKGVRRLEFLKTHEHEWSEDGFCIHCGADGNG